VIGNASAKPWDSDSNGVIVRSIINNFRQ